MQTFLSVPIIQKCQILSCETLVANERYGLKKCRATFFAQGAIWKSQKTWRAAKRCRTVKVLFLSGKFFFAKRLKE